MAYKLQNPIPFTDIRLPEPALSRDTGKTLGIVEEG